MPTPILLLDESNENTEIDWWNNNRKKLNEVIKTFNQWQINGFSVHGREVVEALINRCEAYGQDSDFSDWQMDTLKQIRQHLKDTEDIEPRESSHNDVYVTADFFEKLEAFGERWLSSSGQCELRNLIAQARV